MPVTIAEVEQGKVDAYQQEINDRLLVRPVKDERGSGLASALDLPARVRSELEQFFLHAIFFEPKNPRLLGWVGPEGAERLLDDAVRAAARGAEARRRVPVSADAPLRSAGRISGHGRSKLRK